MNAQEVQEVNDLIDKKLKYQQFNVAKTSSHGHNGIDSTRIQYFDLINAPNCFCVGTTTNGTTAVNVFGSGGAQFSLTITGIFLISNDTTSGNISVYNNNATVATIVKGTTASAVLGATTLSNISYSRKNPFTIKSDSAGNATVFITFTT